MTDNLRSYIFSSSYTKFDEKLSLFSLPVAREGEQRTANIILPQSHKLWKIKSRDELRSYLEVGFPQLNIDEVFTSDEIGRFLEYRPGKFPDPQYAPNIYAKLEGQTSTTHFVLIGDAAHSFPPDLGLGVNSALEDVYYFGKELEKHRGDVSLAAIEYEKERLPESRALVRLVRKVFPYQYNHVPWRFKLSLAKILLQMNLHKWTFGLIDEPVFRLSQNEKMSYTALERSMVRSDILYYAFLLIVLLVPIFVLRTVF